jgi:hypothetical protein
MHPDVHLVRTRPPILDVPPLVWIEAPSAPKLCIASGQLWEWPEAPPRRSWRPAFRVFLARRSCRLVPRIAFALVLTLGLVAADEPAGLEILVDEPARLQLPVPDEPIWCACVWWPSGPAAPLPG